MAASKLQMNWSAVGFTPSGGTLAPITKIQECSFDRGGTLIPYLGDGDRYPTTIVNATNHPRCTIRTGDVATIGAWAPGTVGVVTATHNDAMLAAGGNVVYVLVNAVVENSSDGGAHAQYGEAPISFLAYSSDGVTSPLSFTRT
jgi:hypothetical protein